MIRSEALKEAIKCADLVHEQSLGGLITPERASSIVRLGELWVLIADRLPDEEPEPPEPPEPAVVLPQPPDDDEDYTTARCGHTSTVVPSGGKWLHVMDMSECDNPPTRGGAE